MGHKSLRVLPSPRVLINKIDRELIKFAESRFGCFLGLPIGLLLLFLTDFLERRSIEPNDCRSRYDLATDRELDILYGERADQINPTQKK